MELFQCLVQGTSNQIAALYKYTITTYTTLSLPFLSIIDKTVYGCLLFF